MIIINIPKKLTDKIPFYAVERLENGTVIVCAKNRPCGRFCIMRKCCMLREENELPD